MLSGVKFIPRNQLDNEGKGEPTRRKSGRQKSERSDSSSDDVPTISKRSRRRAKWDDSDELSSDDDGHGNEEENIGKRKSSKKRISHCRSKRATKSSSSDDTVEKNCSRSNKIDNIDVVRKEMGLDWMLKRSSDLTMHLEVMKSNLPEEPITELQKPKINPRELNPFLKNDGTGYPDDVENMNDCSDRLKSSSLVGDGGASWRMKALKRAKEQADREGKRLDEVVEERWGSLGRLTESAASHVVAPARAHLQAIRQRQQEVMKESRTLEDSEHEQRLDQKSNQGSLKDPLVRYPGMKAPKVHDSLSWGMKKGKSSAIADRALLANAAASINKFVDDGSFMSKFLDRECVDSAVLVRPAAERNEIPESKVVVNQMEKKEAMEEMKQKLTANQLAAKALQLRMKGKHEEAEKLMLQVTLVDAPATSIQERSVGRNISAAVRGTSGRKIEDDADRNLAERIMKNRKYSSSSQADEEYDYELAPSKKSKRKISNDVNKMTERRDHNVRQFMTQQERCIFCFENPSRPKHLVVSIANFTYLMLPTSQPVVPGHCCILPLQHESSARSVDNGVWEEIRNFKKCLIMMFSKQEKELVFLETVIGLGKQRRHCLIECIPLPHDAAREAPLYFKKAIDEAEDEWSQHNAKKLIDTSEKGLRGSIPKDFPYFHVEFGLDRGFVHVIDDENNFKSHLGLNVIRGMLRLPEEDMFRHRRRESVENQLQAAANFKREWQHFDWTKQLD